MPTLRKPVYIRQKVESIVQSVGSSQLVERCQAFCEYPLDEPCERNLFFWHQLLEFLDTIIEKHVKVVTNVFLHSVSQPVSREELVQGISFLEDKENVTELIAVLETTLHLVESASIETRFAYNSIKSLANLLLHPNLQVCFLCLEIIHSVLRSRAKYRILKFRCDDRRTFLERVSTLSQIWLNRGGLKLFHHILQGGDTSRIDKFLFPEKENLLYLSSSSSTTEEELLEDSESDREETPLFERRKVSVQTVLSECHSDLLLLVEWMARNEVDRRQVFELVWSVRFCSEMLRFDWEKVYRLIVICLRVSGIAVLCERILHQSGIISYLNKDSSLFGYLAKIAAGEVSYFRGQSDYLLPRICVECFSLFVDRNFYDAVVSSCGMSSHQGLFPTLIRKQVHSFVRMDQLIMEGSNACLSLSPHDWKEKKLFVESLFHFIDRFTKSSSNPNCLSNAGLFPSMLLIFSSTCALFSETVAQAARTWLCVLEQHSNLVNVFRDAGGLNIIAERVFKEVCGLEESIRDALQDDLEVEAYAAHYWKNEHMMETSGSNNNNNNSNWNRLGETQKIVASTIAFRGVLHFGSFIVIHDCLKLFMVGHGTSGGRYTREIASSKFCRCLRQIIARPTYYGGDIFALAGKTISQIAHSEPTTTSFLIEARIADALIESLGRGGIPCSNSALKCVPNLISALCLVPAGLEKIQESNVLFMYFKLLSSAQYIQAIVEDTAEDIGSNFEELVRHVPALKNEIVSAVVTFLSNSVKVITKKKDKEETLEEYSDSENEYGGPTTMTSIRVDSSSSSPQQQQQQHSSHETSHSEDIRSTVACVAALLVENFAKGNREIQAALMSRNVIPHLLSLRLGFVESRQSKKANSLFSGLHSVVNALHRLESRYQEAVFKQWMKVAKEDLAQFLDCGVGLGDVWLAEEWTSSHTSATSKRALQRKLYVFARRVCIDLQIFTSLAKHSNFPLTAWNSQNASAFISSVAAAERLTRYHLSRAFADVQISVASSDSDLCDFSTARITHAAPFLEKPVDIHFFRQVCHLLCPDWDPIDKKTKEELKSSFQPFFYPRDSLKGLAWALATFVAAVQPLYTVLCKKMNRSQRYTIRSTDDLSAISDAANSFATSLGNALTLHIIKAKNLFSSKVGSLVSGQGELDRVLGKLPASWTYLIGILGEIRATLFEGMNSRNSVPFTPLLVSFIESGGLNALLEILELSDWTKEMVEMDKQLYQLVSKVRESVTSMLPLSACLENNKQQGDYLKKEWKKCSTVEQKVDVLCKIPHAELHSILYRLLDHYSSKEEEKRMLGLDPHFVATRKQWLFDSQSLLRRYSVHSSAALVASTVSFNLTSGVFQLVHLLITHSGRILSDAANNNSSSHSRQKDRDYHERMRWMFLYIFKIVTCYCKQLNECHIGNHDQQPLSNYPASTRLIFDEYIYMIQLFQEMKNQMPGLLKTQEEFSRQHLSARRMRNLRIQQRFTESPLVAQLVEMGFSRRRAVEAVRRANTERLEYAMEVLLSLPEDEEEDVNNSNSSVTEQQAQPPESTPRNEEDETRQPQQEELLSTTTDQPENFPMEQQLQFKAIAEEMNQLRLCFKGTKLGQERIDAIVRDSCQGMDQSMQIASSDATLKYQCSVEQLKSKFHELRETLQTCIHSLWSGNVGQYSSFIFVMLLRALVTRKGNNPNNNNNNNDNSSNHDPEEEDDEDNLVQEDYQMLANWTVQSIQKDSEQWNQADLIVLECAILCAHHLGKAARQCLLQQNVAYYAAQYIQQVAASSSDVSLEDTKSTRPEKPLLWLQQTANVSWWSGEAAWNTMMGYQQDKLCACLVLLNSLLVFETSDRLLEIKDWLYNDAFGGGEEQQHSSSSSRDHSNVSLESAQPKMDALFRSIMLHHDREETKELKNWSEEMIQGIMDEEQVLQHIVAATNHWNNATIWKLHESTQLSAAVDWNSVMDACLVLLRNLCTTNEPKGMERSRRSRNVAQACVQLLASMTQDERMVDRWMEKGGLEIFWDRTTNKKISIGEWLLSKEEEEQWNTFQVSSALFSFRGLVRNVVEDAHVLQDGMEDSIRYILKSRSSVNPSFLIVHSLPMIAKNPVVYLKALARTTSLKKVGNGYKLEWSPICRPSFSSMEWHEHVDSIPVRLRHVLQCFMKELWMEEMDDAWKKALLYVLHDLVDTFPCVARALVGLCKATTPCFLTMVVDRYIGWNRKEQSSSNVEYAASLFLLSLLDREDEVVVDYVVHVLGGWLQQETPRLDKIAGVCRLVSAVQRLKVRWKLVSSGFPDSLLLLLEKVSLGRKMESLGSMDDASHEWMSGGMGRRKKRREGLEEEEEMMETIVYCLQLLGECSLSMQSQG